MMGKPHETCEALDCIDVAAVYCFLCERQFCPECYTLQSSLTHGAVCTTKTIRLELAMKLFGDHVCLPRE